MLELVEGRADLRGAIDAAQVGEAADWGVAVRPDQALGGPQRREARGVLGVGLDADLGIEAVTGSLQTPEELHDARIPTGDVVGDFLEDPDRSRTSPALDDVGHI